MVLQMDSIITVLDWATVLLSAGGLALIAFGNKELAVLRYIIVLVAIISIGRWNMWAFTTKETWGVRCVVGGIVGALILGGFPALWHWVKERERLSQEQTTKATQESSLSPKAIPPTVLANGIEWKWPRSPIGLRQEASGTIFAIDFAVSGKNASTQELHLQDAYIISGITSGRLPLLIGTQSGWVLPDQIGLIPPGADINLRLVFDEIHTGVPEKQFMQNWGIITLVVKSDGKEFRKTWDAKTIQARFAELYPPLPTPRIEIKSTGNN